MTGRDLLIALGRTKRPVLMLDGQLVIATLTPGQALELVRDAPYKGSGTKHRVSAIRRYTPPPPEIPNPWGKCQRSSLLPGCGACIGCLRPALQPSPDWVRSMGA